ncbi:hypothetical protein TNCV_828401 [Trichonephila clavipes]|nr:hypothetical protein TNCV_828401 [Trichonephila clavipes]
MRQKKLGNVCSKACFQKVISGRALKSRLPLAKMQQNGTEDYWRPVTKMHYRPSVDYSGIILRGLSQSSNSVLHNEEMSGHEGNCCPLDSPLTHQSAEIAPVCPGWHPPEEIKQ